ncbi:MAG: BON domain-containing protein [Chthoniobacteraceae bacterium]
MKLSTLILTSVLILPLWAAADDGKPKAPDNSGKNERDRDNKTLTPGDQSNAPADIKLVATIRQMVVKDKSLSSTAKNCKIITTAGRVTLRGPVNTAEEKATIEAHAVMSAGKDKVDNQLEVKAAK